MEVLTDTEVRFLAGKIAERLKQGVPRQAIVDDVASVCGREWAEAFLGEVQREMSEYPSGPMGRTTLRKRVTQRTRPAWVGLALGGAVLPAAILLAGQGTLPVLWGAGIILAWSAGKLALAAWQLRSLT